MDNKDVYYTRVLPIVKYSSVIRDDKLTTIAVENLTNDEIKSIPMSKAKMLWDDGKNLYISEMPLNYKQGLSVKFSIVYLFDELSTDDQEKYFDRTIMLPLTIKDTVKIYSDNSKKKKLK